MPIFYGYCPHCEELKAVEVELTTEHDGGDGPWANSFRSVHSERVPSWDDCACVLTPEEERDVLASAEDNAINAEPDYPDAD